MQASASQGLSHDEVVRLAFEIDDMTSEEIAWATEKLRDATGVHDVASVAMHGKKGRASTGIRILATVSTVNDVIDRCFALTSTIGIRHETVKRTILNRSEHEVNDVAVKVVARPRQQFTAKASSDDLAASDSLSQRRQLAEAGQVAALQAFEREE